jgi:hypothetical protein
MIHSSMLDFARSGRFGQLQLGLERSEIIQLLGNPDRWGGGETEETAIIWEYGEIEFYFDDITEAKLSMIFTHEGFDGGETLIIDPWICKFGLQLEVFENQLMRNGIHFTTNEPRSGDECRKRVVTESGGFFSFVIKLEEEGYFWQLGLNDWGIK